MENKKDENGGFLGTLLSMAKVAIVFLLIYMYWESWIKFYREKQWLYFGLMSILPALILYYLIWDYLVGGAPPGGRNPYTTTQY